MGVKIFSPAGVDQKSNDLVRKPEKLRYSENMQLNQFGEYTKRPGTAVDADIATQTSGAFEDVHYIKSMGRHFWWDKNTSKYKVHSGSTISDVFAFSNGTSVAASTNLSVAEYLNTAIFTHEENQISTMKYDGNAVYKAGLPVPTITSATSGALFVTYFYQFIDGQTNTIYGPARIEKLKSSAGSFTISTLKDTGFYEGYLKISLTSGVNVNLNSLSRTLNYSSLSPDIKIGSKVVFRQSFKSNVAIINASGDTPKNDYFVLLQVDSIDAPNSTITFTEDSFKGNSIIFASSITGIYNVMGAVSVRYYFSNERTVGQYGLQFNYYYHNIDNSSATNTFTYDTAIDTTVLLSNFYDITNDKLRPPRCKYIIVNSYQLIYSPALSFWDFDNKEILYTNNDLIMYSDLAKGDLGENTTASNRQLIGDTYDGEISGMVRVKDSVIIFKNRSLYAIDGDLVPGQYSLRRIETDAIGCVSSKSIISVSDVVLFQGQDGIYAINGYACKKFSNELDKFFTQISINPSVTRSVLDTKNNKYLFFCNSGVAAFDYEFGEWFIWKDISANKGVTIDNTGELRMFRSSNVFKLVAAKSDSGAFIDAWIDTAWFDMMEPSLLKKATDLRMFALNNTGQSLELRYFMDWSEEKSRPLTDGTVTVLKDQPGFPVDFSDNDTKSVLKKLDITQSQSISFRIRNRVADEDLNLTGYEIIMDINQGRDKNVK